MTERERLIELIGQKQDCGSLTIGLRTHAVFNGFLADYLLANGVIVPPCKVGDTVYAISLNTETSIVAIHRGYIGSIDIRSTGNYMFICHEGLDDEPYFKTICGKFEDFGKFVFLSKEDAEKALKERSEEK